MWASFLMRPIVARPAMSRHTPNMLGSPMKTTLTNPKKTKAVDFDAHP